MNTQTWSWLLAVLGVIGMVFVGKKQWWAFVLLGANETLWIVFAITQKAYGFIFGAVAYIAIHAYNANKWRNTKILKKDFNWLDEVGVSDWTRVDL